MGETETVRPSSDEEGQRRAEPEAQPDAGRLTGLAVTISKKTVPPQTRRDRPAPVSDTEWRDVLGAGWCDRCAGGVPGLPPPRPSCPGGGPEEDSPSDLPLFLSSSLPLRTRILPLPLSLLQAGYCLHPGFVVARGAGLRPLRFPALVALIDHPTAGPVLFDTGYAPRVLDATHRLPYRVYRWLTPMHVGPEETVAAQLRARGIAPEDMRHVVLSHFHADHTGGLFDFPNATVHATAEAWDAVKSLTGARAVRSAVLPQLHPPDLSSRLALLNQKNLRPLPAEWGIESDAYDVLGDGSLWGVPLPGHATGQMGLLLQTPRGPVFLVADAVWLARTIHEGADPHPLARAITPDPAGYRKTVDWLRSLARARPDVRLIPSHCTPSIAAWDADA